MIVKLAIALAMLSVGLAGLFFAFQLPDFTFTSLDISHRAPLGVQFVGFLSCIVAIPAAMFFLVVAGSGVFSLFAPCTAVNASNS